MVLKIFHLGTLIETLQGWGIGFGNQANAHTSFEETVYKLDLPDSTPETLAKGLQVFADYAGRLTIADEEVEKERGVILAEMRDRNSPGLRIWRSKFAATYSGTNAAERFPIGTKEIVEATTPELMRDFYQRFIAQQIWCSRLLVLLTQRLPKRLWLLNFRPYQRKN